MKLNGKSTREDAVFGPLTFKRKNDFVVFLAQPVWDYKEFDALCPKPENTTTAFMRNEHGRVVKQADPDAPEYAVALEQYATQKWGYYIWKSLELSFKPHGNLEWEKIDYKDPMTWVYIEEELRASFSFYEFAAIMDLVDEANALDAVKLEENSLSFLKREAQRAIDDANEKQKKDQNTEAESSSSSPLANASA